MSESTVSVNPPNELTGNELPPVLAQAERSVSRICSASDYYCTRLDEIEQQIEETSGIEGVRVLRFRLADCLQKLRDEIRGQREEMSKALSRLQKRAEPSPAGVNKGAVPEPELDKISGLEARESAEQAMTTAIGKGGVSYAALFVVDRLHLINAQFGYATGNRILRELSQHLRSALRKKDQLFRWTGPAFVAVIERGDAPAKTEAEIQKITESRLEAAVQIGNGCVRLPIVRKSILLPLGGSATLTELVRRLDAFTGSQTRQ